jgi:sarcosine oxidase subunit gamma
VGDRLTLAEATIACAWNVQGQASGIELPRIPNTVARADGAFVFWLGPRSWLALGKTPEIAGGAMFDVSASRVAFTIGGMQAATFLAKHCPLDLHPSQFAPGTCAQSLFGQVNALYYRHEAREAFTLFVARSFARGVEHHLRASAAQYGYDDAPSRPFVAD